MIEKLKAAAIADKIPIISDECLAVLLEFVSQPKIDHILEIGTAVGYSAINMALNSKAKIISIERNSELASLAMSNIKEFKLEQRITVLNVDALEYNNQLLPNFDIIYIDAAKAQNIKFLEKYIINLKADGHILVDNLLFHNLVGQTDQTNLSRNVKQLIRKINDFLIYIEDHDQYHFELRKVGDGIGIISKKG